MNDQAIAVRVWDLPTRIFHWLLALCVVSSVGSAWIGGNAMAWHFRFGYASCALLAFRISWGIVGGRWSRFASFVYSPSALWRYLRGTSSPYEHHEVGHSPLGALSVFGLLGILIAQVGTGLLADDDISSTGPLNQFVSDATSHALTRWHKGFGQWLVVGLVGLHMIAIGYYLIAKRRNLVSPMWRGDKPMTIAAPPSVDNGRSRALALILFVASAGLVYWVVSLGA